MDFIKAAKSGSFQAVETLVKSQGIPSDSNWTDYKALNIALINGNTEIAKYLLSQNCRVNRPTSSPDKSGSTPLHKAVDLEDIDLVNQLLQRQASITAVTHGNNTPLHLAFISGHTEIVDLLVQHMDHILGFQNCKNDYNLSHLHIACSTTNSKFISKFLALGAADIDEAVNADSVCYPGCTALHFAILNRSIPAVKALLDGKSYLQGLQKDSDGQTPWQLACQFLEDYSVIVDLLSKHQPKGQVDKHGCVDKPTNFHVACMTDNPQLIEQFLKNGASVNIPVGWKVSMCPLYSPLHFAIESRCIQNVEVLLKYGADVNWVNGHNMTALHLAMYTGKNSLINLLYSRVEDKVANLKDDNWLGYFHVAVSKNELQLVTKMLKGKKQIDVNSQVTTNHRRFSSYAPLHFVVEYGHKEMMELLVKHGADVNIASSRGTALQLAIEERRKSIIDILLEIQGVRIDLVVGKKTLMHILVEMEVKEADDEPCTCASVGECMELEDKSKLSMLNCVERLVELGSNVNAKDEKGNTVLHLACNKSSIVERLLSIGADVNVENDDRKTPFECLWDVDVESSVLFRHVQNLRALGLKVSRKNEERCDEILKMGGRKVEYLGLNVNSKITKAKDEIERMKNEKIDKRTTLHVFVRMDVKYANSFAMNEELKSIVKDGNLKKWYPVYGYLIKLQYRSCQKYVEVKATKRRSSLKSENGKENRTKRIRC